MEDLTSKNDKILEIKNASFSYGNNLVLENVSFDVKRGDYVGIIGPNGGGKTTLLNIVLGLLKPQKGEVFIFGKPLNQLNHEQSFIGYVPQRLGQLDINFPATVEEIVASGRTALVGPLHRFKKNDKERIEQAMVIAEVAQFRNNLINNLSGGERQRVMIARALAGDPKILILDEPTTGVDVAAQEHFYHFLSALNQHHGLTIVFVSHDIDVVVNVSRSILILNRKVIHYGPARDLDNKQYIEHLYGDDAFHVFHKH